MECNDEAVFEEVRQQRVATYKLYLKWLLRLELIQGKKGELAPYSVLL